MTNLVVITGLLALLVNDGCGFEYFQERIPNGDRVPHPCKPNYMWHGVGHRNSEGGVNRNEFGRDFKEAGFQWSRDLCMKDSDGDGLTNGQELGDPNCEWTRGQHPKVQTNITHPGVCGPWGSDTCRNRNSWISCDEKKLDCPAVNETDVRRVTLRLPPTAVPAKETSYFCMIFELPTDGDFHMVATQPVLDNRHVMHHILLFGCDESGETSSTPAPYECGMVPHPKCIYIIGTWTLGSPGDCMHSGAGFRIGRRGFRIAALQLHWNNPHEKATYSDSSGITLYYSAALRQFDAAMFAVGQEWIEIKPQSDNVTVTSVCPADCTSDMFKTNLYITRAINHMHYLGKSQKIELYRGGKKVRDITNDLSFNYDSPVIYKFEPPIEVLAGDEIRTTCVFQSKYNSETIYFGEGTADEMCYGFLTYYPRQNITIPFCTTWKSVARCRRHLPKFGGIVDGCKWRQLLDSKDPETLKLYGGIMSKCAGSQQTCEAECKSAVKEARSHVCLRGDIGDYIMWRQSKHAIGRQITSHLTKCYSADNLTADKLKRVNSSGGTIHKSLQLSKLVIGTPFLLLFRYSRR
ncbi:hypothetical protein ScPMuIL_010208 [Solemya velum]